MTATVLPLAESDLRKIVFAINQLAQGRSNAVGSITLTTSTATTTVTATNCGAGSTPLLTPTTANASAEFGNGTIRISSVANGSFVITHANSTQTDRTFLYAVLG
jgi:hypothetical protein